MLVAPYALHGACVWAPRCSLPHVDPCVGLGVLLVARLWVQAPVQCHPYLSPVRAGGHGGAEAPVQWPPPGSRAGGAAYCAHSALALALACQPLEPPCCDFDEGAHVPPGPRSRCFRPSGSLSCPVRLQQGLWLRSCLYHDAGGAGVVGPRFRWPPCPQALTCSQRVPASHPDQAPPLGVGPCVSSYLASRGACWHNADAPQGPSRCTVPHSWHAGSGALVDWPAAPILSVPWPSSAACCGETVMSVTDTYLCLTGKPQMNTSDGRIWGQGRRGD